MDRFSMNGYLWRIKFVNPNDKMLMDRTGKMTLAEEWVCNFIADYGAKIFSIAYSVLGNDAWMFIPYELDKVIA